MEGGHVNAYELDKEVIVQNLIEAAARAGVSGSGPVIDLAGSAHFDQLYFWAGVVRARLDRVSPPITQGDKLKAKTGLARPTYAGPDERWPGQRKLPNPLIVNEVWYVNKKWHISFQEKSDATSFDGDDGERVYRHVGQCRFNYDDFEPASEKKKGAA